MNQLGSLPDGFRLQMVCPLLPHPQLLLQAPEVSIRSPPEPPTPTFFGARHATVLYPSDNVLKERDFEEAEIGDKSDMYE